MGPLPCMARKSPVRVPTKAMPAAIAPAMSRNTLSTASLVFSLSIWIRGPLLFMPMIKKVLLALTILMAIPQPLLAQATGRTPRIGLLGVSLDTRLKESLLAGVREHGYANVTILDRGSLREYPELLPAAKELVGQNVDVIVAFGAQAPRAAFEATKTLPIVIIGADPVVMGMAKSYSRPGGNVTGVSGRGLDLYP